MKYSHFVVALERFCLDHGFEIAGTCEAEGIYGEITVIKVGAPSHLGWTDWQENTFNFITAPGE